MIANETADLGPHEATFQTDLRRIRRGKIIVVLVGILLAGLFAVLAIFGAPRSALPNEGKDDVFIRIMCGAFAAACVALGVHMFRKVSREVNSRVDVYERGMIVDWLGEQFTILWSDIRDVKISEGGGIGLLDGGQRSTLLFTFADKTCTLLPVYLANMPELAELVSAYTGMTLPKLRK